MTPQELPEEGTAEELYQKIQQEKQKLIAEGKIKKEKPLPGITEEEKPFDIPESWKWVRLSTVIDLLSGSDLTPDKYNSSKDGIPYITGASNLDENKLIINRWTLYPNNIAHKGDLLLTCKGTVGKTAVLNENEVHIARQLMSITPVGTDTQYLQFYIQSQVEGLKTKAKSMIPGIERNAKIEELLPLIDRYEKAWSRLEEFNKRFPDDMQKSILQMAIQGKLVEQRPEEGTGEELYQQIQQEKQKLIKEGKIKKEKPLTEITEEEKPFDIPVSWKWVRLNSIYNFIDYRGKTPTKKQHGIRLIGSANIRNGYLDFSKEDVYISEEEYLTRKSRGLTKNGDILFITEGGSMGYAAINTWVGECSCGQRVITLQAYSLDLIANPLYLRFIQSTYFQKEIRERKTGSAAQGIKGDTMKKVLIPLPPLAEQKRIVARLEELLPLCEALKS